MNWSGRRSCLCPRETLLVVDAMTGQDAVNIAKAFDEKVSIDGVIITKLDGDARGGAALSVRAVTGKHIKFIGMGEKLDALEVFYPGQDGLPHPRHGRRRLPGREGPGSLRREEGQRNSSGSSGRTSSPWRISGSRSSR